MASIAKELGHFEYKGIQFGIECEVEGNRLPEVIPGGFWHIEHDGSLRGGLEYIFSKPMEKEKSINALKLLFKTFDQNKTVLDYSFRTSTHVHVNVGDLELNKVMNIVFLYTLVEDLFVQFCAEHRQGNRFCLRFKEANHLYGVVEKILRDYKAYGMDDAIANISQDQTKYGALNLYTLRKYGTLEFRSLEGTNDIDKITKWLTAIENIVNVGQRYESIADLHDNFFQDPEKIVDEIFTNDFKFEGWKQSVEESYSQAFHLVLTDKGVW